LEEASALRADKCQFESDRDHQFTMKAKDLIKELQQLDPETLIVQSQDPEGNGFSPIYQVSAEMFYNSDEGDLIGESDLEDMELEKLPRGYKPAAVLWPE
jgi:hypothetical protein